MPGVFLSHSSQDKPFVTRLALDLVNRFIPVWLDSWQMAPGDSLLERIFQGIDTSSAVVLVLSPYSVASRWVQKELTGALTKEDQLGRRFLIPIRAAECEVPLMIADRLYADFTQQYLDAFEKLADQILALGVEDSIPVGQQIVPLFFTRGRFLNEVYLRSRLTRLIRDLPSDAELEARQFVASPDPDLTELRRRFVHRVEHVADDPFYSPQFENEITARYADVRRLEVGLQEGLAQIVNVFALRKRDPDRAACIAHWYARIVRTYLLDILWSSQVPDAPILLYGQECATSTLHCAEYAAKLFEVEAVDRCALGRRSNFHGEVTRAWVDANAPFWKELSVYEFIDVSETASETLNKWIIPQIAFQCVRVGKEVPVDVDDWLLTRP